MMNKEALVEYGKLLFDHFHSSKLTNCFLADLRDDDELKKMINFLKENPNTSATDLDEYLIRMRKRYGER